MKKPVMRTLLGSVAALSLLVTPLASWAEDAPGESSPDVPEVAATEVAEEATTEAPVTEEADVAEAEDAAAEDVEAPADTTEEAVVEDATVESRSVDGDIVTLDLYNLTDVHGHIEQATRTDRNTGETHVTEAGLSAVGCYLEQARATNPDSSFTLLGDNVGASPFVSGILLDNPTIAALNVLNPLASTIGNHELDLGQQAFKDRIDGVNGFTEVKFPYLGANVDGLGEYLGDYVLWESPSGVKVAFIGAIAEDVPSKLSPNTTAGMTFNDPIPVINTTAQTLKESGAADVVIAMLDDDVKNNLPHMGKFVDGLMGGDTHVPYFFTNAAGADGHTLAGVASGSYTDNLGNIQVKFNKATGEVVSTEAHLIPASEIAQCGSHPVIDTIVEDAIAASTVEGQKVVATVGGPFYRGVFALPGEDPAPGSNRGIESTLGDLAANAMRDTIITNEGKPVDIGIINAGGLRTDLIPNEKGEITYAQTFEVMPFSNEVGYVTLTGANVKELLEQQWKRIPEDSSRPMLKLGLSDNVQYTYDPTRPMGDRITSVLINDELLDPEATYTVGSVTFLLAGGDSFPALTTGGAPVLREGMDRDYFNQYLADNPGVAPATKKASIGVTMPEERLSLGDTVNISLRGLSFSESSGITESVTLRFSNFEASTPVDNNLEEPNSNTIESIITTDGAGQAEFSIPVADICEATGRTDSFNNPIAVGTDFAQVVNESQELRMTIDCTPAVTDPTETPATDETPAPSATPEKPGTDNNGKLPVTGTNAGNIALAAIILLLLGAGLVGTTRYRALR
ncbi:MAG: bifunctional UDP-sugar hydrolase/5'-nucleotidase [Actinomycetaceae bacterium]|nr:bifunctional UDP-sugar hydrolase/5'-nucleotidase [Actinomycetaceae bacterium]